LKIRTARAVLTPWLCRNAMISRTIFCLAQAAQIAGYAGGVLGPELVLLGLGAATVPDSRAATLIVVRIPPWKHVVVLEVLGVVIGALTVWDGLEVPAGR
jgi:hypothetical protein